MLKPQAVSEADIPTNLVQFAHKVSSTQGHEIGKTKMRGLILKGMILLDGRPQNSATRPLRLGQVLSFAPEHCNYLQKEVKPRATIGQQEVIWVDDDILAIAKPAGLNSNTSFDETEASLEDLVKSFAQNLSQFKGYCEMTHRLDRDTSGLVLFALNKDSAAYLHEAFKSKTIQKTYHAITIRGPLPRRHDGSPQNPYALDFESSIGRISKSSQRAKYGSVNEGGKFSKTRAVIMGQSDSFFHLEVRPETGRPHQIRVHLSEAHIPIVGDTLYGYQHKLGHPVAARTLLHAFMVTFSHPTTGKTMSLCAPFPEDFSQFLDSF